MAADSVTVKLVPETTNPPPAPPEAVDLTAPGAVRVGEPSIWPGLFEPVRFSNPRSRPDPHGPRAITRHSYVPSGAPPGTLRQASCPEFLDHRRHRAAEHTDRLAGWRAADHAGLVGARRGRRVEVDREAGSANNEPATGSTEAIPNQ